MGPREQLIAYVATLIAIVLLVTIAAIVACLGHPVEALGVGAAVTGLIGLTRTPTSRPAGPLPPAAGAQAGGDAATPA